MFCFVQKLLFEETCILRHCDDFAPSCLVLFFLEHQVFLLLRLPFITKIVKKKWKKTTTFYLFVAKKNVLPIGLTSVIKKDRNSERSSFRLRFKHFWTLILSIFDNQGYPNKDSINSTMQTIFKCFFFFKKSFLTFFSTNFFFLVRVVFFVSNQKT